MLVSAKLDDGHKKLTISLHTSAADECNEMVLVLYDKYVLLVHWFKDNVFCHLQLVS
jgi:hypothetical protein